MAKKRERRSGLIKRTPYGTNKESFMLNYLQSDSSSEFSYLKEEFEKLKVAQLRKKGVCYIVHSLENPSFFFFTFCTEKRIAKSAATYYKVKMEQPLFNRHDIDACYIQMRVRRVPEFDKYIETRLIPILEQLKYGVSYRCSHCGKKHYYTYEDYEDNRCYIVKDGYNVNEFTEGYLVCNSCFRKIR